MVPHSRSSQGPEAFSPPFFSILPDVCILPLLHPHPLEGAVLSPTLPYLISLFLFVLSTLITTEVISLYLLLVTAYFPPFKTTSTEVYQFYLASAKISIRHWSFFLILKSLTSTKQND